MKNKFLFIFLLSFLLSFNVLAEVSFEAGVSVQKEAENSAIAKEEALKEAYREAFLKVADRLTTKENVSKLNSLTDDQLMHFISETDVVAEKNMPQAYFADLNIKINGELLKAYMAENDMLQVVSTPAEILIIPSYTDTEYTGRVLFEDGNVWRQAWLEKGNIQSGNLSFSVISDQPFVKELINTENIFDIDQNTFDKLTFAHSVKNIITVHAVRAGRNNLVLVIKPFNGEEKRIMVTDEQGDPFDKAIETAISYITQLEQNKNIDQSAYKSKIKAMYTYAKLKDWLDMQKRLKDIPQIEELETGAIEGSNVHFSIAFSGTLDHLTQTLKDSNIGLIFENGKYIIQ